MDSDRSRHWNKSKWYKESALFYFFRTAVFKIQWFLCANLSTALADMSDFIESEAEESEEEFEEKDLKPKKTQRFMEDDDDGKKSWSLVPSECAASVWRHCYVLHSVSTFIHVPHVSRELFVQIYKLVCCLAASVRMFIRRLQCIKL